MIIEIQTQPPGGATHFETSILLEGRRWTFVFYTNKVDDLVYFDLIGDDQLPRFRGAGLSAGVDLLFRYRYKDVPPGILFLNDKDDKGSDPSPADFDADRFSLYYLTSDDPVLQ